MDLLSKPFLFLLFPICLCVYYLIPRDKRKAKNYFVCLFGLFVYSWTSIPNLVILLIVTAINWGAARIIEGKKNSSSTTKRNVVTYLVIAFDIGLLAVAKVLSNETVASAYFPMPIGVSYYIFKAVSYVIDVKKDKTTASRNFFSVCFYLSFFPQMVAGPITRSKDFISQIDYRVENLQLFCSGIYRFSIGFFKKMVLCSMLIPVTNEIFYSYTKLGALSLWIGAIGYTLLIYFDFSGYSDLAIGTGEMFGFRTVENFDYPYICRSISEFWRRWHITLGSWFRDYVYIPLGGNRCSISRNLFNTLVVWVLTGLWHGITWNFIAWGLWSFAFIMLERRTKLGNLLSTHKIFSHIYSLLLIIISWVFFRSENLISALGYIGGMFGKNGMIDSLSLSYLKEYGITLCICMLLCVPIFEAIYKRIDSKYVTVLKGIVVTVCLVCATIFLIAGTYNPFIYTNF